MKIIFDVLNLTIGPRNMCTRTYAIMIIENSLAVYCIFLICIMYLKKIVSYYFVVTALISRINHVISIVHFSKTRLYVD